MEGRTSMEENVVKFSDKLKELLSIAKKKKNVLAMTRRSATFQ